MFAKVTQHKICTCEVNQIIPKTIVVRVFHDNCQHFNRVNRAWIALHVSHYEYYSAEQLFDIGFRATKITVVNHCYNLSASIIVQSYY